MKRFAREPPAWIAIAVLIVAVAVPRIVLLPFNENYFGDAIPRTVLAEHWMANPHVITAFGDGAGQYGPFHIYLVAFATAFTDRDIAGRLVSLLCGVLTVVPLYRLGRRLAGWQAGMVACLALAVWGLHIQFSTTAASEALAILLVVSAFDALSSALESGSRTGLAWAAMWISLATAVRYDVWMYPLLLVLVIILTRRNRPFTTPELLAFGAACLVFPVLWMIGNYRMHGDPAFPMRYINQEHQQWVARDYAGFWRALWLRSQSIGFWPVVAALSLTPGIAAFAVLGMWVSWRERQAVRWLIVAAFGPLVYYAVRMAILLDFAPLARFMAVLLVVMLLFVWDGYLFAVRSWGEPTARRLSRLAVILAVGMPFAIGAFTFRQDGWLRDIVRPLSPASTNPRPVMAAAAFVRSTVAPAKEGVVVDIDGTYFDLPVVFYGRLAGDQVFRVRSGADLTGVERERPPYLVRFDRGTLTTQEAVHVAGPRLTLGGLIYEELDGFGPPVHVYRLRP